MKNTKMEVKFDREIGMVPIANTWTCELCGKTRTETPAEFAEGVLDDEGIESSGPGGAICWECVQQRDTKEMESKKEIDISKVIGLLKEHQNLLTLFEARIRLIELQLKKRRQK